MKNKESFVKKMMKNYCSPFRLLHPGSVDNNQSKSKSCDHLLHLFRRSFLGEERSSSSGSQTGNKNLERPPSQFPKVGGVSVREVKEVMASFRNVKELMDAGIRIKCSRTRHLRDISIDQTASPPA